MKTMANRITLRFICIVIFPLCLVVLHGCSEFFYNYDYDLSILSPDNNATFEQGDTITFSMNIIKEPQNPSDSSVTIFKGTIIQWTSDVDGDFWKEELDHDIKSVEDNDGWFVSYTHQFSSSALSAGNHKITCKANTRNESGTYNLATASIRISVTESQTSSTTTTTTDGGGNLDVTACTALNDLVVRAGEKKYYNNNTECWASIILKNIGMKGIQAGFYVDDNTLDPTRDGWVFIYLDPGQEFEDFIQPSGWGYSPQTDSHGNPLPTRVVKTSRITAIYSEDGCSWILKEVYATDGDVPTTTQDISGLDSCN